MSASTPTSGNSILTKNVHNKPTRRRRICSGNFHFISQQKPPLALYSNTIPSLDGRLSVSRSYIPSTYETTVEVKIDFELCYKIYHPNLLHSNSKAPILVVHGGPSIPSDYLFPLLDFMDERTVIFFDQLGCGKSDVPTDITAYSIHNAVDDLEKLVNHLNLDKFHIYGHSFGGILAFEYLKRISEHESSSLRNPECLSMTLSSAPCNVSKVDEEAEELLQGMGNVEDLFQKEHICRTVSVPKPLLDAYTGRGKVWEGTDVINHYVALPVVMDAELMPPILCMRGEYDFVSEKYGLDGWTQLFNHSNVKCVTLDGCSHYGLLENGRLHCDKLNSFVGEHDMHRQLHKQ